MCLHFSDVLADENEKLTKESKVVLTLLPGSIQPILEVTHSIVLPVARRAWCSC